MTNTLLIAGAILLALVVVAYLVDFFVPDVSTEKIEESFEHDSISGASTENEETDLSEVNDGVRDTV